MADKHAIDDFMSEYKKRRSEDDFDISFAPAENAGTKPKAAKAVKAVKETADKAETVLADTAPVIEQSVLDDARAVDNAKRISRLSKSIIRKKRKQADDNANKAVIKNTNEAVIKNANEAVIKNANEAVIKNANEAVIKNTNEAVIKNAKEAVIKNANEAVIKNANEAVIKKANEAVIKDTAAEFHSSNSDNTSMKDKAENEKKPDEGVLSAVKEQVTEQRRKKVEDFALDNKKAETDTAPKKVSYGQREFENYDDAPKILSDILQVKSNLFLRLCVLLFTGLSSLLITIANDLELPVIKVFDRSVSPSAFLFSNTIMGLLALGVSYTIMTAGLKNMFMRKPDNDSIAAVGIFVSVIAGIATLFEPDSVREGYYHVYISAAIVGLIFNTLGKMMIVQRTEKNFRYIAGEFDRYAVKSVDSSTAVNFGRGAVPINANMATMRKTGFVEDFIKNSYAPDASDDFAKYSAPMILLIGLVTGLLSFVFDKHAGTNTEKIFVALAAFSGTVTMCSSLSLILAVNLPINRAAGKYLQNSAVILGYSAVNENADANSVLAEAAQLFPKESIELANMKLLSTEPLDECILMASSLVFKADSVLKTSFYRILKGKLDMLYPVESYIFEDELGLSGWIKNKRVLLGTRRHMEKHSIDGLPPVSKETEYGKDAQILYLSVSGVVSAMFAVKVTPSAATAKSLHVLEREGMVTVIRTADGFLTEAYLEKLFDLEHGSVKILPFRYQKEYENEVEYRERESSSMLCSGSFPAFVMLMTGVKRIRSASQLGIALQAGSVMLGAAICIISMLLGTFSQITPTLVVIYHLVFAAMTTILLSSRKL